MKILIAVPCMDTVATGFAQSLAALNKTGDCTLSFLMASLIYDSRDKLVQQALSINADYIMWFDSDMIFDPNTMLRLIEDIQKPGVDAVSGLYFRRVMPYTPVLFKTLEETDDGIKHEGYDDYPDEMFPVDGIGFGCVLTKTTMFLDMALNFGEWFQPVRGAGEDIAFCLRAKKLGYHIWVDPDVKCGHVSHSVVTEDFYKCVKGQKNEG